MSVGKDSILRAANADAKKTEVKVETKPAEEVRRQLQPEKQQERLRQRKQ